MLRRLRRLLTPVEVAQIRWLGTSVLAVLFRTPVLVLHTTGRRSGRPRATPVAWCRGADGSLLVVGGAGGQRRVDWVANLRAEPTASVTVNRRRLTARAVELTGAERAAVWPTLVATWPRVAAYERRAGRPVPVFRLVPTGE